MASLKLLVLCVSLAVVGVCSVEAEETPSVLVRISHNGDFEQLYKNIPRVSIDHPKGDNQVDAYILREDLPLLSHFNYEYEIIEEDREEYFRSLEHQKLRKTTQTTQDWTSYHHYADLEACLRNYSQTYPNQTELFTIGQSVQGRELWGLKITQNIQEENPHKPELHYVGNMHGNEVVGRELLLRFIGYYLDTYKSQTEEGEKRAECAHPIVRLMEETVLYVIPSMNPDGFELGRRENAHRYDLNRNFPDQFNGIPSVIQPENLAIMNWVDEHNFVISINFHGGSVVVSYPYDGSPNGRASYSKSPEDEVIKMLALEYASFNQEMLSNREFSNGVTNGAAWYPLYGGMADWKYFEQGDIELTVELSYSKWPASSTLQHYWEENQHSMVNFLTNIFRGVWGRITVENDGVKGCSNGLVWAQGIARPLKTNDEGYYFRVLTPGDHALVLSCGDGRNSGSYLVTIPDGEACTPLEVNHHFEQ